MTTATNDNTSESPANDGWRERWKPWLKRLWFVRGILAAVALANLVPTFLDLTRFEFLTAFHALLVGWGHVAQWVGEVLSVIPLMPELSAAAINTIILIGSLVIPGALSVAFRLWPFPTRLLVGLLGAGTYLLVLASLVIAGAFDPLTFWYMLPVTAIFVALFAVPATAGWRHTTIIVAQVAVLITAIWWACIVIGALFQDVELFTAPRPGTSVIDLMLLILLGYGSLIAAAALFILALIRLEGFARGLITLLVFAVTLELLYHLNTPLVAEWVNCTAQAGLGR